MGFRLVDFRYWLNMKILQTEVSSSQMLIEALIVRFFISSLALPNYRP